MTRCVFVMTALSLMGCQSFSSTAPQTEPTSHSVMTLWELYRDCQKSSDVETALSTAKELRQSADMHVVPAADLPGGLDAFIRKQPVRTTVDPKAMAASCTLQAARASIDAGRHIEARQLLQAVMRNYPEPDYVFYVDQARVWMRDLPADPGHDAHSVSAL